MTKSTHNDQAMRIAGALFDVNNDGFISFDEIKDIITAIYDILLRFNVYVPSDGAVAHARRIFNYIQSCISAKHNEINHSNNNNKLDQENRWIEFTPCSFVGVDQICISGVWGLYDWYSIRFFIHLVFPLLKGRPLVIYAQEEHKHFIFPLVNALSTFIPGPLSSPCIETWRSSLSGSALSMSDLSHIKLMGLSKDVKIPYMVQHYVSILDYEERKLVSTPEYHGDLLEQLLVPASLWKNTKSEFQERKKIDEETFMAHLHNKFLEMGIKASLYHQKSMEIADRLWNEIPGSGSTSGSPSEALDRQRRRISSILRSSGEGSWSRSVGDYLHCFSPLAMIGGSNNSLGITSTDDLSILSYLSDVVQQRMLSSVKRQSQQMDATLGRRSSFPDNTTAGMNLSPESLSSSHSPPPMKIRLDHSPTTEIKNSL
eukprot:gb/GECH01008880.1/.p1 GENE.gb/GECH01008880.1/~~gb/GECH01008880.1/.p1  ORF type:complete len:429 (+),score=99.19 gb/GECH01008880.1/:1-1287(+)